MYQTLTTVLNDRRFHELLLRLDRDLATPVRAAGCPSCSAVLHSAAYERKPRGMLVQLPREHRQRLSFCCAKDGCRQRATPPVAAFSGAQGASGWARRADLGDALWRHRRGSPDFRNFNTDQGAQFTGSEFISVLKAHHIHISMDGKGRWRDNVFVERLWRSVKYEGRGGPVS